MSLLQKFKRNPYCVDGRQYSGTNNMRGLLTAKGTQMLKNNCIKCKRNKSMTLSDATIEGEGLNDFFKVLLKSHYTLNKKSC